MIVWTEIRLECAAKCDRCPFSFGRLWRGIVDGEQVELCERCRHIAEEGEKSA